MWRGIDRKPISIVIHLDDISTSRIDRGWDGSAICGSFTCTHPLYVGAVQDVETPSWELLAPMRRGL